MKLKNYLVILLSILVLTAISFSIVRADDDDDGERERDDDHYEKSFYSSKINSNNVKKQETKTIVTEEIRQVEVVDTDKDGIPDNEDPHPDKPEIYFVSDANQNGIVDSFEQ